MTIELNATEHALLRHFLNDYSMVLARRLSNDFLLEDTPEVEDVVTEARRLAYELEDGEEDEHLEVVLQSYTLEGETGILAQDNHVLRLLLKKIGNPTTGAVRVASSKLNGAFFVDVK